MEESFHSETGIELGDIYGKGADPKAPILTISPKPLYKCLSQLKRLFALVDTSYEDAEMMVNNLILFAAFIFSFSTSLVCGTFSHDDLAEADLRYARLWYNRGGNCWPFSTRSFLAAGYESMAFLMMGLALSFSLGFSNCREDPQVMVKWTKYGAPAILLGYHLSLHSTEQFDSSLQRTAPSSSSTLFIILMQVAIAV